MEKISLILVRLVQLKRICFPACILLLLNLACKNEPTELILPNGIDSTSHVFSSWVVDTLGEGNSILYDVAIINDTLVYAVGELYFRDSTGQIDSLPYNLAQWNGRSWSPRRVNVLFRGNLITPTIYGVFAFSASDIWFAGGMVIRGDGENWVGYDVRAITGYDALSFNKCWGTNSSNMYFTGLRGSLAHSDGNTWERIESGTTLPLIDIYGRSANEIYACGSDLTAGQGIILKYDGTGWTKMMDSYYSSTGFDTTQLFLTQLYGAINSVWTDDRGSLYAVGDYIYKYQNGMWSFVEGIADNFLYATLFTRGGLHAIRGNASNDFIAAGERTTALHYNGLSGVQVGPVFNFTNSLHLYSVDMKHSQVIAVGSTGNRAGVVRLRRQ